MCWNREVSWTTGITATALSSYLLFTGSGNDIPVALVSLAVALMQFAEALMWEGDPLGGHLGILALFLQPLALGLGVVWTFGLSWIWTLVAGGLFAGMWAIFGVPTLRSMLSKAEWPAKPGCGGHLQWSFLGPMLASPFGPFYWIVMLGGWLLFRPFQEGLEYSMGAITTLLITWFFFPGEWGSLWCFVANALPLGRMVSL